MAKLRAARVLELDKPMDDSKGGLGGDGSIFSAASG
jgi:hypothetical protein